MTDTIAETVRDMKATARWLADHGFNDVATQLWVVIAFLEEGEE